LPAESHHNEPVYGPSTGIGSRFFRAFFSGQPKQARDQRANRVLTSLGESAPGTPAGLRSLQGEGRLVAFVKQGSPDNQEFSPGTGLVLEQGGQAAIQQGAYVPVVAAQAAFMQQNKTGARRTRTTLKILARAR
jgi:hypothetical protein